MSLHGDLFVQARHLATREPKKPKQASLRRAVSTAYYGIFHFLIDRCVHRFVRGSGRNPLREVLGRAFQHSEMKDAAKSFAGGTPRAHIAPGLAGNAVQPELRDIARAFVSLQEARHDADYDRGRTFTRKETLDFVELAENAVASWSSVKDSVQSDTFLVALLVHRRTDR